MTDQIDETRSISHVGPVPNVSVHAHMRSGPHAVTADPLDLVVVVELMFLFGEQARRRSSDEPLIITPQSVLERLREMGVRSGNGSRLVGRDAVYNSFARLRAKGYIRRIVESDEKTGQRTGVAYEFYDWPAWNPDAPAVSESSQVTPTSGNAGSGDAGSRAGKRTKNRSAQVGATSGNAGSGDAGSSESSQVTPTSGNAGSPPHPPEEVDTSSPYPLNNSQSSLPSQREEGAEFSPEDIRTAEGFLQRMQKPWNAGRATARKSAPRLLAVMRDQGWPAIGELTDTDRALLEQDITKNPGGVTSYAHVLPKRIADLSLYDVAKRPSAAGSGPQKPIEGMCLRHPAFREDDCAPCRQAERDRAQRGRSEPRGMAGDGTSLLARLRAAQQDTPGQGD